MRIAGVQMDIQLMQVEQNLIRMEEKLREAVSHGAQLVVFPECAVTGYCFTSLEEARPYAQTVPGPATEFFQRLCAELNCFAVFGMLEKQDDQPETPLYNVAVLTGPEGVIGCYRKVHLPYLGIDMFTSFGQQLCDVHAAGDLRVGMNICYDAAFPEAARCLGLNGADLICLPTNWPPGSEQVAAHVINARALENNVYFISVNRVGTERTFPFIGRSKIAGPHGQTLAEAAHTNEEIIYAQIDPAIARQKHLVRRPGSHEIHRLADRHPELYAPLLAPHGLTPPGR